MVEIFIDEFRDIEILQALRLRDPKVLEEIIECVVEFKAAEQFS